MITLTQITVFASQNDFKDILQNLYVKVLYKDSYWHFFNEEEMGLIIRVSKRNVDNINKELKKQGIRFEISDWNKEMDIVNEYRDIFIMYFHTSSEMAIKLFQEGKAKNFVASNDFRLIGDRIVHSLYNNVSMLLGTNEEYEPYWLSHVLVGRAVFSGIRSQYKKMLHHNT